MTTYHGSSIKQALNYLLENGIIEPAERETARKKLQYIKKGKKRSYKGIAFEFGEVK